jgi:hypothetical protein
MAVQILKITCAAGLLAMASANSIHSRSRRRRGTHMPWKTRWSHTRSLPRTRSPSRYTTASFS